MHVSVKGLMGLFGIDFGGLIKEGKVPGVRVEEDDLIFDLEQILPPTHIEGKVVSVRMEGEKIIQIFGGSYAKPVKNMAPEITWPTRISSSLQQAGHERCAFDLHRYGSK